MIIIIIIFFKGESIPIRVFLAGYDLTPTMRDINKKFSVRYFLNLVLMDTEDRRYFKQQEITLWRKGDKQRKMQMQNPHMPKHLVGNDGNFATETNNGEAQTPSSPSLLPEDDAEGDEDGQERAVPSQIQNMKREEADGDETTANNGEEAAAQAQ